MLPSARLHIAGERKRSRWDQVRLVMPIGVIVVVAIVCVIGAVLTSARRADQVAFENEQRLIALSLAEHGQHALHLVESVAATPSATARIRNAYDPQWADQRIGQWLAKSHFDVVTIVGADDRIEYRYPDAGAAPDAGDFAAGLAPSIDLLRGRLAAMPAHSVALLDGQDPANPGRSAVVVQQFLGKPAYVAAVAVGADTDLAAGNAAAPIVLAVKYIGPRLLAKVGAPSRTRQSARDRQPGPGRQRSLAGPARRAGQPPSPGLPGRRRSPAAPSWRAWRRSSRWRWPASRCSSFSAFALCGAPRRKSPPANGNCAIWRCTIRSAACPIEFFSASASNRPSTMCAAAGSRPRCSTSISIISRTSTIRSATTSATSSSST